MVWVFVWEVQKGLENDTRLNFTDVLKHFERLDIHSYKLKGWKRAFKLFCRIKDPHAVK